jgi:CHAT domain-containing protein
MDEFYTNLWKRGLPKLEALRRAQITVLKNPERNPRIALGDRYGFEVCGGRKTAPAVAAQTDYQCHGIGW